MTQFGYSHSKNFDRLRKLVWIAVGILLAADAVMGGALYFLLRHH